LTLREPHRINTGRGVRAAEKKRTGKKTLTAKERWVRRGGQTKRCFGWSRDMEVSFPGQQGKKKNLSCRGGTK